MKTILGFDSWTEGSSYFERLVPALERRGFRMILIHIGSWGHDPGRPLEENHGRLHVRDIAWYGGASLSKILDRERPEVVIFFSTRALAHQAFNAYCLHKGIPTLHLYHGLVSVQDIGSGGGSAWKVNWANQFNLIRTRLAKNVTRIWPTYWKALLETRAPLSDWLDFGREIVAKIQLRDVPAPRTATTTAGGVYTSRDVQHIARVYRMPADRIHVVGNPDLEGFGLRPEDLRSWAGGMGDEIVYVDTALIECGLVFAHQDEFIFHLRQTRDALASQGLKLLVKLHPAHKRTGVPERLEAEGIPLCSNEDFVPRLKAARAALVEPSTASLIPGLLGTPLLLAKYGPLTEQRYGAVLTDHPLAEPVKDIRVVGSLLEAIAQRNVSPALADWIASNSGPLPAADMPERVAGIIAGLCRECEAKLCRNIPT